MKIEIEKSEYDRLKSREEKLMAYYEWFVDKENDLATVEDIINKNIELEEENKKLKEEMKNRNKYRVEENKRLRKGIDIRLDSMGVKYIMTEEGDYFTKSDFKITE